MSQVQIWIIVFDELELIIFVSQGLTLSTASLVEFNYKSRNKGEFQTLELEIESFYSAPMFMGLNALLIELSRSYLPDCRRYMEIHIKLSH